MATVAVQCHCKIYLQNFDTLDKFAIRLTKRKPTSNKTNTNIYCVLLFIFFLSFVFFFFFIFLVYLFAFCVCRLFFCSVLRCLCYEILNDSQNQNKSFVFVLLESENHFVMHSCIMHGPKTKTERILLATKMQAQKYRK